MKRLLATLVLLAGCGSAHAAVPAATTSSVATTSTSTSAVATTTAAPVATTTVAHVTKNADPKVRAKVEALSQLFRDRWPGVLDALAQLGVQPRSLDERIDGTIQTACTAKAAGFVPDQTTVNLMATMLGKVLVNSGSDVATFLASVEDTNRKVAAVVDCI